MSEQPKSQDKTSIAKKSVVLNTKTLALTLAVAAVVIGGSILTGFLAGHTAARFGQGGFGRPTQMGMMAGRDRDDIGGRSFMRGGQRPFGGSVTTVSDKSITIKSGRTDTVSSFVINDSTTVTNNGAAAKVADIKTGNTVLIVPSQDGKAAVRIVLYPTLPGDDQTSAAQ